MARSSFLLGVWLAASPVIALCASGCAEGNDAGTGGESGTGPTTTTTGATTTASTTSSTTAATTSTGPTSSCTPDEGLPVDATCGLFVQPSAPAGGDCSQSSPCRTLSEAVARVTIDSFRVYVCSEELVESATVPAGVELYGGFDCEAGWSWSLDGRTPWTAGPDEIPLRTQGAAFPIVVSGFDIEAQSATIPGGSSVAILADGGALRVERGSIVVGDGAPGEAGVAGVAGADGTPGLIGNNSAGQTGGDGGVTVCAAGFSGGDGAKIVCNGACMAGAPEDGEPGAAQGGGAAGTSDVTDCTDGSNGVIGVEGTAGVHGVGIGTIDENGFTAQNGTDGADGAHGKGGGGGGAKTDVLYGGGGGGSGGCAGTKGTAGGGGGSSIAIVALDVDLEFVGVTATVGKGGDGALGGLGGAGGLPGLGAAGGCISLQCSIPGAKACKGGDGGVGGAGGTGGNGAGGHALIIAYSGADPSVSGLTYDPPQQSQAGLAPAGASMGVATVFLEFP
ncbi:MAG: hypothetical protein JNL21_11190 [Myxococcales bacterium]|nr:hypothetical protein [Myxococcales bacterium]